MRRKVVVAAAATLTTAAVIGGVVAGSGAREPDRATDHDASANTAEVERGRLSDRISQPGILTFRARADGSPYTAVNQAEGVYTHLPTTGDEVACGDVLYRVDDRPILLLCGATPAYRALRLHTEGRDVRQLNRNLRALGYETDPRDARFTPETAQALQRLQHAVGLPATGALREDGAVVLPEPIRVAKTTATLGGPARPGAPVLTATSATPEVRIALDPTQQDAIHRGDRARITLPDNTSTTGRVARIGVAQAATSAGREPDTTVTIPVAIRLDRPRAARDLDQAPVQVDIATAGVDDALSVPVTALIGSRGGGFAVEVVRPDRGRALVPVTLGLFDSAAGRVQVDGDLRAGDDVVVPAQ